MKLAYVGPVVAQESGTHRAEAHAKYTHKPAKYVIHGKRI